MPHEARIFVKTGLIYLTLTFALGGVLLILEALGRPAPEAFALQHAHFGAVGWLVNIVIGSRYGYCRSIESVFPQPEADFQLVSCTRASACSTGASRYD